MTLAARRVRTDPGRPTGQSAGATFDLGTKVTLSATDGRDTVWSGGCSSGGQKTKTCTLTVSGNTTVAAAVQ